MGKSVMVFGLGDVGQWALEFLARCEGVGTIVTADLREDWGVRKTNTTAVGAAQQGYYKAIEFHRCDVKDIDGTAELLKTINPDVIYSCMTVAAATPSYFFHLTLLKNGQSWLELGTLYR